MGEPEADRGKVIKEAVEDFFDMDIVSAIGSIRDAATSDWTRYAHRSPHATVAFQAGRAIAERLKTLADQIEAKTSEVAVESGAVMEAANATDSLDIVLREITAVKEAEEELQQRIKETE